jgi:hypothetical protein
MRAQVWPEQASEKDTAGDEGEGEWAPSAAIEWAASAASEWAASVASEWAPSVASEWAASVDSVLVVLDPYNVCSDLLLPLPPLDPIRHTIVYSLDPIHIVYPLDPIHKVLAEAAPNDWVSQRTQVQ